MYQDELTKHLTNGDITELHVACSREGAQKDYVQVREHAMLLL